MSRPILKSAWLASVLAASASAPAAAQTIRGTVSDSATAKPLDACVVSLLDQHRQASASAVTDSTGVFALRLPGSGTYTVRFMRIGYRTVVSRRITLEAGSDTTLAVSLATTAVELPPVTVPAPAEEDTHFLEEAGFFQRRSGGQGFFLDPRQVAERLPRARMFADLLRGTPGVTILRTGSTSREAAPKLRGMPSLPSRCTGALRRSPSNTTDLKAAAGRCLSGPSAREESCGRA